MSNTPTPGQICYEGYFSQVPSREWRQWVTLFPPEQARWEAAAQAVLAMQKEKTP
jgi:hypothetical protein